MGRYECRGGRHRGKALERNDDENQPDSDTPSPEGDEEEKEKCGVDDLHPQA